MSSEITKNIIMISFTWYSSFDHIFLIVLQENPLDTAPLS